jgi:hypothetical protein
VFAEPAAQDALHVLQLQTEPLGQHGLGEVSLCVELTKLEDRFGGDASEVACSPERQPLAWGTEAVMAERALVLR